MSTTAEVAEGGARVEPVLAAGAGVAAAIVSANAVPVSDRHSSAIADVAQTRKLPDTVP